MIATELQQFIAENVVLDGAIEMDEPLICSGKIDSMGLLEILSFVEQRYDIELFSYSSPRDFESVRTLAEAIRRALGEMPSAAAPSVSDVAA